ncbi:hypothetical protein AALP_AA8G009400 [Arabis alpina]|uniref:Uncharacterized protein n=1 Tax=Arabis alpina TaxID=50452 RepID=A0A087G465_ARAAL|nr:hypothetical protein AALP_AA8G009400 [Arabis alpina]
MYLVLMFCFVVFNLSLASKAGIEDSATGWYKLMGGWMALFRVQFGDEISEMMINF